MLCLKCGNKDTLHYSELCEDCEKKSYGGVGVLPWLAIISVAFMLYYAVIRIIDTTRVFQILHKFDALQLLPMSLNLYEFVSGLLIAVLSIYSIYLFFRRKRKTIKTLITLFSLFIFFTIVDFALAYFLTKIALSYNVYILLIKNIVIGGLWLGFLLNSERMPEDFSK